MPIKINLQTVVWLLVIAASIFVVLQKTHYSTDISIFLPENTGREKNVMLDINKSQQAQSASLLMIALEGADARQLANISRSIQGELDRSALFNFVINGNSKESAAAVSALFKYRYLLDSAIQTDTFSHASMRQAFAQRLEELRTPAVAIIKQTLTSDPLANGRNVFRAWQQGGQLKSIYGVWFTEDKSAALLIADIKLQGFDLARQQAAIDKVNESFSAITSALNMKDKINLHISGPGVFAVATRADIVRDSKRLSTLGTVAILLIFIFAYRSLRLIILGTLPIVSAVLVAIAVTSQVFGAIHGITIAFGITLLGICTDYPVHFFSHLQSTSSVRHAIEKIWPTIRLGVLTTCVGFAAMLTASIAGLAQLGVFAISGLLTAALVTRYVLPGLLPEAHSYRIKLLPDNVVSKFNASPARNIKRGVLLVLIACSGFFLLPINWENDLAAISPLSESAKKMDQEMRQHLQLPDLNHIAFVEGKSVEEVLVKSEALKTGLEKLQQQKIISDYQAPFEYLPSQQQQRNTQALLPDSKTLTHNLQQALQQTPFKPASFQPFIDNVLVARSQTPLTYDMISDMPVSLPLKRLLLQTGQGETQQWYGIIRFSGVVDATALANWAIAENNVTYVNIRQAISALVFSFRDEALQRMLWGMLVLVVLLLISLRDIRRSATIAVNLVLTVCLVMLSLKVLHMPVSLFHVIAMLLVVGLGLDYSLFFSRPEANSLSRLNTLHGLVICFCSTFVVFAILSLSSLPVLQSIGITVMLGVLYSFLLAWIFSAGNPELEHNKVV